jgi:hypothetical protein
MHVEVPGIWKPRGTEKLMHDPAGGKKSRNAQTFFGPSEMRCIRNFVGPKAIPVVLIRQSLSN